MYVWSSHIARSKDRPGKVANPARGQLNRERTFSLSPFAPENLVSRDGFRRPVPSRPASACSFSILRLNLVLTYGIPPDFLRRRPFIYLKRHTASGQSQVYRVAQLRTDGVHCRESAGTGPVNLKAVPVAGAVILQVTMDQLICTSLSHTHYWYEVGILKVSVCAFGEELVTHCIGREKPLSIRLFPPLIDMHLHADPKQHQPAIAVKLRLP